MRKIIPALWCVFVAACGGSRASDPSGSDGPTSSGSSSWSGQATMTGEISLAARPTSVSRGYTQCQAGTAAFTLTVTNVSVPVEVPVAAADFVAESADHVAFDQVSGCVRDGIYPGGHVDCDVVFDVPAGTEVSAIHYESGDLAAVVELAAPVTAQPCGG